MNIEVGSGEMEQVESVEAVAREPQAEALPMPAELIGFSRRRSVATVQRGTPEPDRLRNATIVLIQCAGVCAIRRSARARSLTKHLSAPGQAGRRCPLRRSPPFHDLRTACGIDNPVESLSGE